MRCGRRQRDEVLWRRVWNVSHHALEVADLFKNANVATEDVDIQLKRNPVRAAVRRGYLRLLPR
jgi:hypothetical protein